MCKVMSAVEKRSYVVPTRITVREYLLKEWLPAIKGTVRPTTFASYATHVEGHIVPALGSLQLSRLTAQAINAFYARLWRTAASRARAPSPPPPSACACHSASGLERCRALAAPFDQSRRCRRSTEGQSTRASYPPGTQSSWRGFSLVQDDRLFALWRLLSMTGCRRGEALGLTWDDLDLEATRSRFGERWCRWPAWSRSASRRRPAVGGGSPSIR